MYTDPGPNAAVTFSDLLESEVLAWASNMPGQLTATSAGELTYPAYNHIPVTYLVCGGDKVLPQECPARSGGDGGQRE
jgi:hypothetical protein